MDRGASSVLVGVIIALFLAGALGVFLLVPSWIGSGVNPAVEQQIRERQLEDLQVDVVSQEEGAITLRVYNSGEIGLRVMAVEKRYGDRLVTEPLDPPVELAPRESATVVCLAGSFDQMGVLTERGNLFPVQAQPQLITGVLGSIADELGHLPGIGVGLEMRSTPVLENAATDENGHFRFIVGQELEEGLHEFWLTISAPGYRLSSPLVENLRRAGISARENGGKIVLHGLLETGKLLDVGVIRLRFAPVELSVSPPSGTSGPTSYSTHVVSRAFQARRTVLVRDSRGNPVYDEVRVFRGYEWEEYVLKGYETMRVELGAGDGRWVDTGETRTVYGIGPLCQGLPSLPAGYRWVKRSGSWYCATYVKQVNLVELLKAQGYTVVPKYARRERPSWHVGGASRVLVGYTATKRVARYGWVKRTAWTKPRASDRIRNVRKVYEVRRTPRTVVETYTAYRNYRVRVPRSWSPVRATLTLTPANGYSGPVYLEPEAGSGVLAELGESELHLGPPASTTLRVTPLHASQHEVAIRAYAVDPRGVRRLVATGEFGVDVSGDPRWEFLGTTTRPSEEATPVTQIVGLPVETVEIQNVPASPGGWPKYDGGTVGGQVTRLYTVNPHPYEWMGVEPGEYLNSAMRRIYNQSAKKYLESADLENLEFPPIDSLVSWLTSG